VFLEPSNLSEIQRRKLAAKVLKQESGTNKSEDEIAGLLESVDVTAAGTVVVDKDDIPTNKPVVIPGGETNPNGSGLEAAGNNVSSVEELEAELTGATRDITEIILHWTETHTNANLNASQVAELSAQGGSQPYNYIIQRDGSLQRGVPLDQAGKHGNILNHNAHSIGIALVGGLNYPTGTEKAQEAASAASITRSQYNTLYQFMRVFFNQYPGGQVLGHMDFDISQEDPGFDARDYAYSTFNKLSLFIDPLSEPAKPSAEIVAPYKSEYQTLAVLEKDPDVLDKKF
jgi:hypothetical protein